VKISVTIRYGIFSWVGFLPRQKVFLPGQWKKTVKTGNNRQYLAKSLVHKLNRNTPV